MAGRVRSTESKVEEPKLLLTIPYTEFVAGATLAKYNFKSLSRNASKRAILIFNTMGISPTQQRITLQDSLVSDTGRTAGNSYTTVNNVANNGCLQIIDSSLKTFTGDASNFLNAPVDSFSISFTVGTEAPTYGEMKVYITEVF